MHVSSAYQSEEHTSELQSPCNLVCRLLLEKKKIRTVATEQRALLARQRVGTRRRREREFVLWKPMILVLRAGCGRMGGRRVDENPADVGDLFMDAVKHAADLFVAVEAVRDVIAQVTAGLGEADGQRMADFFFY